MKASTCALQSVAGAAITFTLATVLISWATTWAVAVTPAT